MAPKKRVRRHFFSHTPGERKIHTPPEREFPHSSRWHFFPYTSGGGKSCTPPTAVNRPRQPNLRNSSGGKKSYTPPRAVSQLFFYLPLPIRCYHPMMMTIVTPYGIRLHHHPQPFRNLRSFRDRCSLRRQPFASSARRPTDRLHAPGSLPSLSLPFPSPYSVSHPAPPLLSRHRRSVDHNLRPVATVFPKARPSAPAARPRGRGRRRLFRTRKQYTI